MAYEDFKLSPQEFEQMAREFGTQKIEAQEVDEEAEVSLSQKQTNLIDILLGFKILERLFFSCKGNCKNPRILKFISDNSAQIESFEQSISSLGETVPPSEIDFEYPETDNKAVKMMANIVSSEILSLTNIIEFLEVQQHRDLVYNIIKSLAQMTKDILNLQE